MSDVVTSLMQLGDNLLSIIRGLKITDIIDIIIITTILYNLMKFLIGTRAGQLVKGIVFLVICSFLSNFLGLTMVDALLQNVFTYGLYALIVIFQPEIRRFLEQMGRGNVGKTVMSVLSGRDREIENTALSVAIDGVVEATNLLQQMRMGALIVFENNSNLNDVAESGTPVNGDPTAMLISNIFFNKAPLHDGALIIRDGKLLAAGCILPLTDNENISASLGTRHRAALGISEDSDALVVVVSEETGQISIAYKGELTRNYNRFTLRQSLEKILLNVTEEDEGSKRFFKRFNSQKKGEKPNE